MEKIEMEKNHSQNTELTQHQNLNSCHEDEIDLVQLWLILAQHKYLIVLTCLLCLAVGAAFAFLTPAKYGYTTSIEIGTTLTSSGAGIVSRVIEAPVAVLAKLKDGYVPQALTAVMANGEEKLCKVEVSNPKKSNLILLKSKGTLDQADVCKKIHKLVLKPLLADHARIVSVPRKGYEISAKQATVKLEKLEDPLIFGVEEKGMQIQIESAKMHLTQLDDQKQLLLSQEHRLAETYKLLRQQIGKVKKNLSQAHASVPEATAAVTDETRAMTMLMITNQIEQNEKRLAQLQERLHIDLANQKEVLQSHVAKNRRDWDLQKDTVAKLQSQLVKLKVSRESDQEQQRNVVLAIKNKIDDIQNTRILGLAVRSIKPTGPGKIVILILAGMLGLMVGILSAFCLAFVSSARQRVK